MQFPNQATIEDLKALIAPIQDSGRFYRLWIHNDGEVQSIWAPGKEVTSEFRALLVREGAIHITPVLRPGDGTGDLDAAAHPSWVTGLYARLWNEWAHYQQDRAEGRCQITAIRGTPELLTLLRSLEEEEV